MEKVIVWRKTVYDTDFCKNCGYRVRKENGNPTDEVLMDGRRGLLYCPVCMDVIAKVIKTDMTIGELLVRQMKNKGEWGEEL